MMMMMMMMMIVGIEAALWRDDRRHATLIRRVEVPLRTEYESILIDLNDEYEDIEEGGRYELRIAWSAKHTIDYRFTFPDCVEVTVVEKTMGRTGDRHLLNAEKTMFDIERKRNGQVCVRGFEDCCHLISIDVRADGVSHPSLRSHASDLTMTKKTTIETMTKTETTEKVSINIHLARVYLHVLPEESLLLIAVAVVTLIASLSLLVCWWSDFKAR
jgi:hypothetical protein